MFHDIKESTLFFLNIFITDYQINRRPVTWKGTALLTEGPRAQTPDWTTNQGLKITHKIMLAVGSTSASVQMISSVGSDVKPLASSPSPPYVKLEEGVKEPTTGRKE